MIDPCILIAIALVIFFNCARAVSNKGDSFLLPGAVVYAITVSNSHDFFTLKKLLSTLGYKEIQAGKTSGSRIRFVHDNFDPIILHKPHPKPVVKRYQLKQIRTALQDRGQL